MSFFIKTNIKVDASTASDFNMIVDNFLFEDLDLSELSDIPSYFDSYTENKDINLDDFLKNKDKSVPILSDQHWRFGIDNILYSKSNNDKFNGAISCLDFFIKRFFEPRGVKLNGSIIGVSKDSSMIYVYNVKNNIISLDENTTRFLIEKYKKLEKNDHNIQDFLKYNLDLYYYANKRGCELFDYFSIFV